MRHNSILREWIWVPGSIHPGAWGTEVYFQGSCNTLILKSTLCLYYPKYTIANRLALPGPSRPHTTREPDWLNSSYSSVLKIMGKIHPWHNSTEATGIKPETDEVPYITSWKREYYCTIYHPDWKTRLHKKEDKKTEKLIRTAQLWPVAHCTLLIKYSEKSLTTRCWKTPFPFTHICPT